MLYLCSWQFFVLFLAKTAAEPFVYHFPNVSVPDEILASNILKIYDDSDYLYIKSPNFPREYPNNAYEVYWIQGNGRPIAISSLYMSLQPPEASNNTCLRDYIIVWDLRYEYHQQRVVCGSQELQMQSYSDSVIVLFVSDESGRYNGFNLGVYRSQQCGADELRCEPRIGTKPPKPTRQPSYTCVRLERICDGQKDCPNGEDEICTTNCGRPNPEQGTDSQNRLINLENNTASISHTASPEDDYDSETRIVGGVEAPRNAWPWQVHIRMEQGNSIYTCGGSVIAPGWIVTAGHCCHMSAVPFSAHELKMRVGFHACHNQNDGITVPVKEAFLPRGYNAQHWGVSYDFCLVKLARTLTFSNMVQPICLPRPYSGPLSRQNCTATGCGNMAQWSGEGNQPPVKLPTNLMAVTLMVVNNTQCARYFPRITPGMMCAESKLQRDTCRGDSGGPFACKVPGSTYPYQYQLSGITSFGKGCASGLPGVFSNPVRMLPFLIETLREQNFWGWHNDTAVPIIDHRFHERPPFQPQIVDKLSERVHLAHRPVVEEENSGCARKFSPPWLTLYFLFLFPSLQWKITDHSCCPNLCMWA